MCEDEGIQTVVEMTARVKKRDVSTENDVPRTYYLLNIKEKLANHRAQRTRPYTKRKCFFKICFQIFLNKFVYHAIRQSHVQPFMGLHVLRTFLTHWNIPEPPDNFWKL